MGSSRFSMRFAALVVSAAVWLTGCESLEQATRAVQPRAGVQGMEIVDLNFQTVTLNIGLKVENPNPFSIHLTGFDYDWGMEGQSLLSGSETNDLRIEARNSSEIRLPVRVDYAALHRVWGQLRDKDEVDYDLNLQAKAEAPLIGEVVMPARWNGKLPIIRMPAIKPKDLRVTDLKLTSASMILELTVDNPNAFRFGLEEIDYHLAVGGKRWAESRFLKKQDIPGKSESTVAVPVHISFLNLGLATYELLKGASVLDYQLKGNMQFDSDLKFLRKLDLPLDQTGVLPVTH